MKANQVHPQQELDGLALADPPGPGEPGANAIRVGAAHVIHDRLARNWGERVPDLTGGTGVEVGAPRTLAQSVKAARVAAHISTTGGLTGRAGDVPTARLMARQQRRRGRIAGRRRHQLDLIRGIDAGPDLPAIDRSFPLT